MTSQAIEGHWDIVVTSLQDICNVNESITFENSYKEYVKKSFGSHDEDELAQLKDEISEHKSNIETSKRLTITAQENLQTLISNLSKVSSKEETPAKETISLKGAGAGRASSKRGNSRKIGRLYYVSKYNPLEPIYVGSEVAYKLKNRHFEEWIQCEVMKVIGDGIKFEIRDPEPDENNNPGQTFKANYKEIILIPSEDEEKSLPKYSEGTQVLARYPETTTFYAAVVVGHKKDGTVRLKFDGEEEVNKEMEAERRLVLPYPAK